MTTWTTWKMPDWMRDCLEASGHMVSIFISQLANGNKEQKAVVVAYERLHAAGLLVIPGTWTNEPPTEPGNIHVRYKDGHPKKNAIIAMVFEAGGGLLLAYNTKIDLVSAWRSLGLERHTTPIQPPVEVKA